ncbi:aminoacyl-tRNA hydrolase [Myxococcota bacterium]|nr:aminoacyl-tRNA hydrolase [Myxococcota bacterium]MBU1533698.1 aminoacyl-tRNA hydrolase [Myxococcota bacterium]
MDVAPFLIVGLGNPGPAYQNTRHNIGAIQLKYLGDYFRMAKWRSRFSGLYTDARRGKHSLALLFPQTFMNLSGESVKQAVEKLGIPVSQILVFHDEVDLPLGTVKVKIGGGTSGHRGLISLVEHLESPDFIRIRMGIGRPCGDMINHVLGCFEPLEDQKIPQILEKSTAITEAILNNGPTYAMNAFNGNRQ